MTRTILYLLLLISVQCYGFNDSGAIQRQHEIDDLKNEIKKFEAHKKELGANITALMDSTKANLMAEIEISYNVLNLDSAFYYAKQCIALSERIGYKKGLGKVYNNLGWIYGTAGNRPMLMESFQKALKIRFEINDYAGLGETYSAIGLQYNLEGNWVEVVKNQTNSVKYKIKAGNMAGACQSYRKMSGAYAYLGDYPGALKACLNALKCAEAAGDKDAIEGSYRSIAGVYEKEGNNTEALKNYIAASKVRDKYDDRYQLAHSYCTSGSIYSLQGDTIAALKKYNDALRIFEEDQDGYGVIEANSFFGNIYFKQGDYDKALKYFLTALKISKDIPDNYNITNLSNKVSETYIKLNKYPEALSYVNSGLSLALKTGFKNAIKEAYKNLSDIYSRLNDFKTAYKYHVLYEQIKDTLSNVENASKLKEMGMQFEFEKDSVKQKNEQDKKDAVIESEIQAQRFKRNFIYTGLATVVLLLVVLIIQRNKIARQRRQKALETERSRISRDLHDDLGSGLTSILKMSEQMKTATNKDLIDSNINKIEENSKLMVDQMRIIIWALNSKNDTLENLLIYMEIYFMDYFENLPVKLKFHLPKNIPEMMMTGMARRNVFLVVKESLNNINKHAQATEVNITVITNDAAVNIVIADNGIGFLMDEKKKFSYGLNNMKSRMMDINGTFLIESVIGQGTTSIINFPMTS